MILFRGRRGFPLIAVLGLLVWGPATGAQAPKELRTKPNVSVGLVNLVNPRPDCSVNPGPVALPGLRQPPSHGAIQMLIILANIPAAGNCPARRVPTIALIYTPEKGFSGVDTVQVEVDANNRTTLLSYHITVEPAAEPL
ncbi:hypothetical protein [Bradyrhizobium sp. I1.7.5]|uniref:hypothetical protein n=1 Tax=Bradyrhizobium sp. I1.7.5 TaxID=3156363 RepID=UPI00339AE506